MTIKTAKELLGLAVRDHRKLIKLSQEELAERAGMTKGSIGLLERGDVWPQYENIQNIAGALGIPESTLFSWAKATRSAKSVLLEIVAAFDEDQANILLPDAKAIQAGLRKPPPLKAEPVDSDKSEGGSG